MPPESFWLQMLNDKGLAVVIIVVAIIAIWKMSRFFAPHVVALVSGHHSLMTTLESNLTTQTSLLQAIKQDHGEKLSDHGDKLDDVCELLTAQRCQFHPPVGGA